MKGSKIDEVVNLLSKYKNEAVFLFGNDKFVMTRAEQILGEYAVLLLGPKKAMELIKNVIMNLGGFKSKTTTEILVYGQIYSTAIAMDKQCLDNILHWIHVSCRWIPAAKRISRMLRWVEECLVCDKHEPIFLGDVELDGKTSMILVHLHEELCRMSFAVTDSMSYGSALNTIYNDKSSIPLSILYKKISSGKLTDYMRYTALYPMHVPENTKGLIVKGEHFNMVLHNGRFDDVSENHISGLMQAMWEVTGVCYLDENTHKKLRCEYAPADFRIRTKPEQFISRINDLANPYAGKLTPLEFPEKLQRLEEVDKVADFELSRITTINDTMDFLLSSLKDITTYTRV